MTSGDQAGCQARLTDLYGTEESERDTDHQTRGSTDTAQPAADAGTDGRSTRSPEKTKRQDPTARGNAGEVTDHEADELETWIATREDASESYGFFHVGLRIKSDLSGTDRGLTSRYRVEHVGGGKDTPHMRCGWGNPTPATAVDTVRSWMLEMVSYPYVPKLDCDAYPRPARTIPAEQFRVFIAEEAYNALREHEHENIADRLSATVSTVNDLPEHHPSESYLETIEATQSVAAQAGAGSHTGTLRHRERRIEATIRAKLGFSKRYGSGTPEADAEFADEDLNTLKRQLNETRQERTEAEARLEELRERLKRAREDWRASIREGLSS